MSLIPTFATPKILFDSEGLKKGWNGSENAFGAKNYHDLILLFLAFLDFEKTTMSAHFLFAMATRFVRFGC